LVIFSRRRFTATRLPSSSVALYTVPYVLFPMISAVAQSRSSAVNASGPSKCTSLPPTSPPDSASDAPGFSPRPAAAAAPASLLDDCFPLRARVLLSLDLLFLVSKQSRRQQRDSNMRAPITIPAMISASSLVLNLRRPWRPSAGDAGPGDGDTGQGGEEAE
jgi:hypothetical protein